MNQKLHEKAPETLPHLLVVDDDKRIRELLTQFLQEEGFLVTAAASAAEARASQNGLIFDLVILDVMMPQETGLEFLKRLREKNDAVPVLMLTARSETEDRIKGLELGSDDYLAKPFDPRELVLRVNNLLKRQKPEVKAALPEFIRFGSFVYFFERGELRKGEEIVRLTERERVLLRMLGESAGQTVSRYALMGDGDDTTERAIDVQINRLRRKIEKDPANPLYLQTVRGIGYRLVI